jgi:hypothetical protein
LPVGIVHFVEVDGDDTQAPKSRLVVALALALTLIISGLAGFVAFKPQSIPVVTEAATMAACDASNAGNCVSSAALNLARQNGPAEGLNAVRLVLESRPDLQQGCHVVAHEVGKKFHEAFGDQAIVPGNDWCSFGYYHGLMQTFGTTNFGGLADYAVKICSTIASTPQVDCMHGLGHAAYTALNSLRDAMGVCSDLATDFAVTCADAVIMEDIFASNNGRMVTSFTPQDCQSYPNPNVVAGCARGLTAELTKAGLDLPQTCGIYADSVIVATCADGFGASLAGNLLSASFPVLESQFTTCAESGNCSSGFGWISFMYTLDKVRAELLCREKMAGIHTASCLGAVTNAAEREQIKRS